MIRSFASRTRVFAARGVAAGWLVLATALGACGIQAETEATVVGPAPDVRAYEDPSDTRDGAGAVEQPDNGFGAEERPVALLDAGDELVTAWRLDDGTGGPDQYRALTALVAPITPAEETAGLSSAVPVGTQVLVVFPVDDAGRHVVVHLSDEFDVGGTDLDIQRRDEQVACTLVVNAPGVAPRMVELMVGRAADDVRYIEIAGIGCP